VKSKNGRQNALGAITYFFAEESLMNTKIGYYSEDSPYKAAKIFQILEQNNLQLKIKSVADIGCGAGLIMDELSKKDEFKGVVFSGYDMNPRAIALAQRVCENKEIAFYAEDLLAEANQQYFDLLLVIDVIEHVPDYMGFAEKCSNKARYVIYHIPLDISVSS
jgi:2-polyprenyl-3-methyl-5-hydroxy-6-metoxy-1,4-benzoquinol methylase